MFKDVLPKKKSFADLQGPIDWLEKAGLILKKVNLCNRAEVPLESFSKPNQFKLFLFDIGLLGCMLELPVSAILSQDYGITKGYFAENFVAQEFKAAGILKLYSWMERNSEIEFLRIIDGEIVPVEVKAGQRTQAKSLKQFLKIYSPKRAIKTSRNPLNIKGKSIQHYPLYLVG